MDANSWYYTFSTAAQVAAALVGLFSIFVVYKLQELSGVLDNSKNKAINTISYISSNTKGYEIIHTRNLHEKNNAELLKIFHELLEIQRTEPNRIGTSDPGFTAKEYDLFKKLVDLRTKIFVSFKVGMTIGLNIIAISLASLVLTKWLLEAIPSYVSVVIAVLFLVLFLFFLYAVGKNTYKIATEP